MSLIGNIRKTLTTTDSEIELPSFITPSFVVLVFVLVLLYIINRLNIEEDLRRVSDLQTEIKELRYEQITTSSELMNMSRQSVILERVEEENLGLKELTVPPRIINK